MAQSNDSPKQILTGRLNLPPGQGARGVEVIVAVISPAGSHNHEWLQLDHNNSFTHSYFGELAYLRVNAGIESLLHRKDKTELASLVRDGRIELGTIDLQDALVIHHTKIVGLKRLKADDIRVALWFHRPHPDISLGSRQFPERTIGTEIEWLIPKKADSIYFLVEQPANGKRGTEWITGKQWLFGPFGLKTLPGTLALD